jgi:hypothetical protein
MGANVDNIPWPKRSGKSRGSKGNSSGKSSGSIAGMAILLLALPVAVMIGSIAFVIYGHLTGA